MTESAISEWLAIAQAGQDKPPKKDIERVIAWVNDLVAERHIEALACDLHILNPEKMSIAAMVAVYRTSAILKDEIPLWQDFEKKLRAELSRRNRDDVTLEVGPDALDNERVAMFEAFALTLRSTPPEIDTKIQKVAPLSRRAKVNQAFAEAWLSNLLEKIRLSIPAAEGILFRGDLPSGKEAEASDLIGTYDVIFQDSLAARATDFDQFERQLLQTHATILKARRDKLPGRYRTFRVGVGQYDFVDPNKVRQTLQAGFEILTTITAPFSRAIYLGFLITEVHPFMDGNGRVSRLMMNAELARASLPRIVLPENLWAGYMEGLMDLSLHGDTEELVTILEIALAWSSSVPWGNRKKVLKAIGEAKSTMHDEKETKAWITKYLT
ncbi:hypothetical protein AA14337_2941 [Acetobacter malorum DSM 14337]|uniref:Fido domain-containing protein n=1 Tax=Acetobacter malorum DSM 14337 TaxID=1307910 RepID=A0ABQ0PYP7_9PROT|nr:Fic family protein [Acetobacter malorum]KXV06757.1 hypothetical protein AD930_06560 [Acetobacter malorum]GBQ84893.1 hypothetical protein AA14337_2941 [Acetobacter malorum DSM 14337]